jgi:predicted nucleic acid-binding Zn ribbon protein
MMIGHPVHAQGRPYSNVDGCVVRSREVKCGEMCGIIQQNDNKKADLAKDRLSYSHTCNEIVARIRSAVNAATLVIFL